MKTTTLRLSITDADIANLLCSALEGGSNYWCSFERALILNGTPCYLVECVTACEGLEKARTEVQR